MHRRNDANCRTSANASTLLRNLGANLLQMVEDRVFELAARETHSTAVQRRRQELETRALGQEPPPQVKATLCVSHRAIRRTAADDERARLKSEKRRAYRVMRRARLTAEARSNRLDAPARALTVMDCGEGLTEGRRAWRVFGGEFISDNSQAHPTTRTRRPSGRRACKTC